MSSDSPDLPDRRSVERVEILGQLQGEVMVFQPMSIVEIAIGGVRIETPFPLQLDSLHDFRLTLGTRSVVVKGRVVYCQITDVEHEHLTYRSGVEFIEPSDRVMSAIAEFIGGVKEGRQG